MRCQETVTVKIEINGVVYPVSCMSVKGQTYKIFKRVNQVIADLANISENVGETRLLAMTSLILADKLNEQYNNEDKNKYYNQMNDLVNWLEKATKE